jgi:hypothetical protein
MPDFTRYQPPGVYVQDVSQPIVTPSGLPDNLVVIVGPSAGYQSKVDTLALFSDGSSVLSHAGVFQTAVVGPPSIDAPTVRTLDGDVLVLDSDYTFVTVPSATIDGDATTKIMRLPNDAMNDSPSGVVDGDLVTITYRFAEGSYFNPTVFIDYDSVTAVYGAPLASDALLAPTDRQVTSPMALAVRIAFENGAGSVMCVATNPADGALRDQFKAAYAKLLTESSATIIVPLIVDGYVTGSLTSDTHSGASMLNFITDLRTHCDAAYLDGFGRIGIVGGPATFDETAFPYEDVAVGAASKRIVSVYPTRFNMFNTNTSQTIEVSGFYAAAGLAAQLVLNTVETGLTRKVLRSFAGLPVSQSQKMSKAFKNNLSSQGVLVIEQDNSTRLVVRHGLTTDMSSITTKEISMVRVADTVLRDVQVGLENSGLIGDPIDEDMTASVKAAISGILEGLVTRNVIVDWTNLLVRQQPLPTGDPSVIDCKFNYAPAVPLNYITVEFALDLSTGAVTPAVGDVPETP